MIGHWVEVLRTGNLSPGIPMDRVSKWLIITRACVFAMTVISALIGGLLASLAGFQHTPHLLLISLGLILAHAANNMVNDLFDVLGGVDTKDYHRAQYALHPILDGLITKKGLIGAIMVCNVLDLAIAIYLTWVAGWPVMAFAVAGLALSVFYVAPPLKLKHRGLGEPAIFLIWGPLMIGGTYYTLTQTLPWGVWLATIPYGLAVTAVLMGKHLDKAEKDRTKGVHTLPVILGDQGARVVTQGMVTVYYLSVALLVAMRALPVYALMVLLTLPQGWRFSKALREPMPATPQEAFVLAADVIPADMKAKFDPTADHFPLWPLWYVVWGVWWVRLAGGSLVLGLIVAWLVRFFTSSAPGLS